MAFYPKKLTKFIWPLMWMGVIFWFSAQSQLPSPTENWLNFLVKKSAHLIEFGILYWLWFRAIGTKALVISVIYALIDEIHQVFVFTRHPDARDVMIDTLGVLLAYFIMKRMIRAVIMIIAGAIFFGTVYFRQVQINNTPVELPVSPSVPSPTPTPTPTVQPVPLSPTVVPPKPQPTKQAASPFTNQWLYPGSNLVGQTNGTWNLTTSDSPDQIYDWYVAKFKAEDLKTVSKIKTRTNNLYEYVLSGGHEDLTVAITINRNPDEKQARITVKLQGPTVTL